MSLQKSKPVCAASKWQHTVAGREVEVPQGGINSWPKVKQDWDKALVNQTQFCLCVSCIALCGLSNTENLSVFYFVVMNFESWLNECFILYLKYKWHKTGVLRRVHGMTLRDKMRSCEISEALNVEPLLRTERFQLRWFGHVNRMPLERLMKQVLLATPTG